MIVLEELTTVQQWAVVISSLCTWYAKEVANTRPGCWLAAWYSASCSLLATLHTSCTCMAWHCATHCL